MKDLAMPITALPRRSLADAAADQLKAFVEAGRWPLGSRIPTEPELAELLQISRNTVREAVRALSVTGMLEVRQGDGTYVRSTVDASGALRELNRASLLEHLEVRALLEAEAARLAALRRSDEDLAALDAALYGRGERQAGEALADFVERDVFFHRRIAQAAGNAALFELYEFFSRSIRAHLGHRLSREELPEPDLAAHAAVLEAIRRQDPEGAALAARAVTAPVAAALARKQASEPS